MPTALLSVWDKRGLVEFAAALHDRGWDLLASGGTARVLEGAGLPLRQVSYLTGEPEMLSGRVKTLHPAIHAAILARDDPDDRRALADRGWPHIDLVAVNLYPFERVLADPGSTHEEIIEHIDIGGVALLRAAAKNFARVTVLSDPEDYSAALSTHEDPEFRIQMARKAFSRCVEYDTAIEAFFAERSGEPEALRLRYYPALTLRYGENPHQRAALYTSAADRRPLGAEILQGKPLSYNNILDLDAAWRAVSSFDGPAVAVVKHNSPCGMARADHPAEAVHPAIESDPVSAFGSVISCNRRIDVAFIEALGDLFVECLIAPGYTPESLDRLREAPNLRVLERTAEVADPQEIRSVIGGLLRQTLDIGDPPDAPDWRAVTARAPSGEELRALRFSWRACQHVKSNAIVLAQAEGSAAFTVGIGGGQPNRVDCVRLAGERAGDRAVGAVLASDAFFPFPDGLKLAADLGVTAVVQPGGSIRDAEVIEAADKSGLSMVFTGVRHFRH